MNHIILSFCLALMLLGAKPVSAATLATWTINDDIQIYDTGIDLQSSPPDNPIDGNLTGSFLYDITNDTVLSADLTVSGIIGTNAFFNGDYVFSSFSGNGIQVGSTSLGTGVGGAVLRLRFSENIGAFNSVGDTLALSRPLGTFGTIFSEFRRCNAPNCVASGNGRILEGSATLTDITTTDMTPVPLPAGLVLMLSAIAGCGLFSRRG